MRKIQRISRIVGLTKLLTSRPGYLFALSDFTEQFESAKSTVSEDMLTIRTALEDFEMGTLETVAGAAGGIKFWPLLGKTHEEKILQELIQLLAIPERILPGNYLYMSDILYNPQLMISVGELFLKRFFDQKPDYVMTVETKGIPLAFMVAKAFGIPVVVVRRETRVTEGPTVNINYVSGSNRRINTMSVGKRSIPAGSKVLIVDDCMKAGATAKALVDLAREIDAQVVGVGVVVATGEPEKKLCESYESLLVLEKIDEETGEIQVKPTVYKERSKGKKG